MFTKIEMKDSTECGARERSGKILHGGAHVGAGVLERFREILEGDPTFLSPKTVDYTCIYLTT